MYVLPRPRHKNFLCMNRDFRQCSGERIFFFEFGAVTPRHRGDITDYEYNKSNAYPFMVITNGTRLF